MKNIIIVTMVSLLLCSQVSFSMKSEYQKAYNDNFDIKKAIQSGKMKSILDSLKISLKSKKINRAAIHIALTTKHDKSEILKIIKLIVDTYRYGFEESVHLGLINYLGQVYDHNNEKDLFLLPLHLAIASRYYDISKYLIENGADIFAVDSEKNDVRKYIREISDLQERQKYKKLISKALKKYSKEEVIKFALRENL